MITDGSGQDIAQPADMMAHTKPLRCPDCGCSTFSHSTFLRHISAVLSPTGKEGIIPIPTFSCVNCGKSPHEVVPPFILQEELTKKNGVKSVTTPSPSLNTADTVSTDSNVNSTPIQRSNLVLME